MKKLNSIIMLLAMIVAALYFTACGDDDDEVEKGESYSIGVSMEKLVGCWTTVGCSSVPSSINMATLANITFNIEKYYDGGEIWYELWGRGIGYESDIELKGSDIVTNGDYTIFSILSFKDKQMTIKVPNLSNAELEVKRFGTLDDNDYRFKLCNGAWLFGVSSDGNYGIYINSSQESNFHNYFSDSRYSPVVRFSSNGTGTIFTRNGYQQFTWTLQDKNLTITTNGIERETSIGFVSIEGQILLEYKNFIWYF